MVDINKAQQFYANMAGGNTIATEEDFRNEINKYSKEDGVANSLNRDEFNKLLDAMGFVESNVKDVIWQAFTKKYSYSTSFGSFSSNNASMTINGVLTYGVPYDLSKVDVSEVLRTVRNITQTSIENYIFADFNEFKVLYTGEKPVNEGKSATDIFNMDDINRKKEAVNDRVFNNYNLMSDAYGVLGREALKNGIKYFAAGKDIMLGTEFEKLAVELGIPSNLVGNIWDSLPKVKNGGVIVDQIVQAMETASGQEVGKGVWHNFNEFKAIFPWEI